jgi:hypothetical protein
VNLVQSDVVSDGSGNTLSDVKYYYDGSAVTASSGVPQHISVSGQRGNLTEVQRSSGSGASWNTSYTYEDTGSVLTSTNDVGGKTTYSYDSAFEHATGDTLPTPSSGVSMSASAIYDESYTGLPTSSTGVNGNKTSVASYDEMLRPREVDYPDGGKTLLSYSPTETAVHRYQNASAYSATDTLYDGYGRESRIATSSGQANPWNQVDICYNADGEVDFRSYPYQSTGFSAWPGHEDYSCGWQVSIVLLRWPRNQMDG